MSGSIDDDSRRQHQIDAYVTHLRSEHRRLDRRARRIQERLRDAAADAASALADVIREIRLLRDDLQHHFSEEEAGGCLDEAAACAPKLGPAERELERQHPNLLADVDQLIAEADTIDVLRESFARFLSKLNDHEAAENRLFAEAFGIEPTDVE